MIRIINNCTFGYWNGTAVEPKRKGDAPFCVSPEREAELVARGIAEYVEEAEAKEIEENSIEVEGFEVTREYLEDLKMDELKEFASEFGLIYKVGTKKAAFIDEIYAFLEGEAEKQAEKAEEPEEIEEADDGEDAPQIDAADAVV